MKVVEVLQQLRLCWVMLACQLLLPQDLPPASASCLVRGAQLSPAWCACT